MATPRDEVISKAQTLFNRYGFRKVTMVDISAAAEISRPTLYKWFADKEAVFTACVDAYVEAFRREAGERLAQAHDSSQQLQVLFDIYVVGPYTWYCGSAEAFDLLVNGATYAPKEMQIYWMDFARSLEACLAGSVPVDLARGIARVLVSFARDARLHAANLTELKESVAVAIGMARISTAPADLLRRDPSTPDNGDN